MLIPHELRSNTSRIHTEKRPQNRPKYHPLQSQIRHHTHTRHTSTIRATRSHESDRLRKCLHNTKKRSKTSKNGISADICPLCFGFYCPCSSFMHAWSTRFFGVPANFNLWGERRQWSHGTLLADTTAEPMERYFCMASGGNNR